MKRSNRLVLLVGVFLAIIAFVLVLLSLNKTPTTTPTTETQTTYVVATKDIPLGSTITADAVKEESIAIKDYPSNGYKKVSLVIGQIVRQKVTNGQAITTDVLGATGIGRIDHIDVPAGQVAIAVQVDQVSGVGTLTKAGDHVDMLVALTSEKFPVVTLNPSDQSVTVVSGLNSTSVKLLLQGMQVLGTLLPPAPQQNGNNAQASPGTGGGQDTTLNGQNQIVILGVTAQQAEVIKYAQIDGNISLVLRSTADFIDPTTGEPLPPETIVPVTTTGITLKGLVDDYGVLVPELVEAILPEQSAKPSR